MADLAAIGKYQLQGILKRGGMGALYLAHDPELERQVAIKVLRDDIEVEQLRERFAREAKAVARLRHPNIVTIFDFGVHDEQQYIVMEFIPGNTVAEVIRQGPAIPLSFKLELADRLCAGLAFAHRAGIVHRDVKPANLMVDTDGTLKIVDFGIARVSGPTLTRTGDIIGTVNYMSPEQISGAAVDHRSDIFAVGAVLYELVTSRRAFPGDALEGAMSRILYSNPFPMLSVCPDIDPELASIVDKALAKHPDDRYQDLTLLQADLAAVRKRVADALLRMEQRGAETTERATFRPRPLVTARHQQPLAQQLRHTWLGMSLASILGVLTIGLWNPSVPEDLRATGLDGRTLPTGWAESPKASVSRPARVMTDRAARGSSEDAPQVSIRRNEPVASTKTAPTASSAPSPGPASAVPERRPPSPTATESTPAALTSSERGRQLAPHLPPAQASAIPELAPAESAATADVTTERVPDEIAARTSIRQSLQEYLDAMASLSVDRVRRVLRLDDAGIERLQQTLSTTRALRIELKGEPAIQTRADGATVDCVLRYVVQRNVGAPLVTEMRTTFTFVRINDRWMIDRIVQR